MPLAFVKFAYECDKRYALPDVSRDIYPSFFTPRGIPEGMRKLSMIRDLRYTAEIWSASNVRKKRKKEETEKEKGDRVFRLGVSLSKLKHRYSIFSDLIQTMLFENGTNTRLYLATFWRH